MVNTNRTKEAAGTIVKLFQKFHQFYQNQGRSPDEIIKEKVKEIQKRTLPRVCSALTAHCNECLEENNEILGKTEDSLTEMTKKIKGFEDEFLNIQEKMKVIKESRGEMEELRKGRNKLENGRNELKKKRENSEVERDKLVEKRNSLEEMQKELRLIQEIIKKQNIDPQEIIEACNAKIMELGESIKEKEKQEIRWIKTLFEPEAQESEGEWDDKVTEDMM